jgi:hypothetical protein
MLTEKPGRKKGLLFFNKEESGFRNITGSSGIGHPISIACFL